MMITPGVNYADQYASHVMRYKKKYPKSIIRAVERYKKWKKRKDIWFDVDRANEMLDFVQSFIRHVKGPLAGQLMELELWEMFVFANMYGWYRKNEKGKVVRVVREAYVQVPKKNGKTIIAAGALLYA
ncbi:terminase large subunit domain-containing protein, partial [Bacillus cereus]